VKIPSFGRLRFHFAPVPAGPAWRALWVASAGASGFYFLMEWVFFATKPSFMSTLGGGERWRVLALSPLPLVAASALLCTLLWLAAQAVPRARGALVRLGTLWPGLVFASSLLLLLDNFTYTLFRTGVQMASGRWRYGYLIVFILFWVWGWRLAAGMLRGVLSWRRPGRAAGYLALGLAAGWGLLLATRPERIGMNELDGKASDSLPNILLLASDGLSAEHMSVYGYERETTPFIRTFAEGRALICENAFANALNSGSSIASTLTGKWPATLRLYYPPEILTGRNAYEHLPGILRQQGYENVDISMRQFADAYDLNMQHAFHEANGRVETRNRWQRLAGEWMGMHTGYFLESTRERLKDRLWHVAGVKKFEPAYEMVAGEATGKERDDGRRVERLLRLIGSRSGQPFFAHVHLLQTHGPKFSLLNPVFSKDQDQVESFGRDFYDDALREFDSIFEKIVRALEATGQMENTVVVLTSDHGKNWSMERIPLIFWFPGGAHAGRVRDNVQNLDIAPTLLDFMGIPPPEWMAGVSLLAGEPPADRPIFFTATDMSLVRRRKWKLDESRLKPPFYGLGTLGLVAGDRIFSLDLATGGISQKEVPGHTRPWAGREDLPEAEARNILLDHLAANGYAVPSAWRPRPSLSKK
jgi:hypothetical protein